MDTDKVRPNRQQNPLRSSNTAERSHIYAIDVGIVEAILIVIILRYVFAD